MTARLFARPEVVAPIRALDPPAIDRLEDIHGPALVIAGDQDLPPIIEIADILTRRIRGARKVIIPDAGHHPNMEHPEEFNQAVLSFLAHA
jgi:3-oxoadipate enol-lactonase